MIQSRSGTAGEVDGLDGGLGVPDAVHVAGDAPDRVGHREVDEEHPAEHEEHDRGELHAFGDGADDEGRGDDREHELVHREHVLGDPVGVVGVRCGGHAVEEEVLAAAEDMAEERAVEALTEDQGVTHGPPEHRDETGESEALGDDGEDVLRADQAAVEEEEAGERHEEHQGGADHHEAVVAGSGHADGRRGEAGGDGALRILEGGGGISVADGGLEAGDALFKRRSRRRRRGFGRLDGGGSRRSGRVLRGRQIGHCRQSEDGESS
jgi:hypothetical protein